MEKYNKVVGNFGEQCAISFLQKQNYKIIDKNFRCNFGEIDIIGTDKDCLCFIEVKARTTCKYGRPSNAVNYTKRSHLINCAKFYIMKKRLGNYKARFDIVEVFLKNDDNKIEMEEINIIKNAFMI